METESVVPDSVISGPGVRRLEPSIAPTASTSATATTTVSKIERAQANYEELLFRADKESLQDIADANVVYIAGTDFKERSVIVLNLWKVLHFKLEYDRVLMYVAHQLDEVVEVDYVVVMTYNRDVVPAAGWLKKAYDSFSYKYKKNCKMFYILHPSSKLKLTLQVVLPTLSSKASKKLKYVDCLVDLHKYMPMDKIVFPDMIYKREISRKFSSPNRVILKNRQMIQFYSSLMWFLNELTEARNELENFREGLDDPTNEMLLEEIDDLLKKTETPERFFTNVQSEIDKLSIEEETKEMTIEGKDLTALLRHIARASNGLHMTGEAIEKIQSGAKSLSAHHPRNARKGPKVTVGGVVKNGPYPLIIYENQPKARKKADVNTKLSALALEEHNTMPVASDEEIERSESTSKGKEKAKERNEKPRGPQKNIRPPLEPPPPPKADEGNSERRRSSFTNHRGEIYEVDADPLADLMKKKKQKASEKNLAKAKSRSPQQNAMLLELKDGMEVTLYRDGHRLAARLMLSSDEGSFVIHGDDADAPEKVPIASITKVMYGFKSPFFKRQVVKLDYEWHSISIAYKEKKKEGYLDLCVTDDISAEVLLLGTLALVPHSAHPPRSKKQKKKASSPYGKGRMLWDRAAFKLRYQSEMLKMPATKVLVQAIMARQGSCNNCGVSLLYTPNVKKSVKVKCAVCNNVTVFPPSEGLSSEEQSGVQSGVKKPLIKKGRK